MKNGASGFPFIEDGNFVEIFRRIAGLRGDNIVM